MTDATAHEFNFANVTRQRLADTLSRNYYYQSMLSLPHQENAPFLKTLSGRKRTIQMSYESGLPQSWQIIDKVVSSRGAEMRPVFIKQIVREFGLDKTTGDKWTRASEGTGATGAKNRIDDFLRLLRIIYSIWPTGAALAVQLINSYYENLIYMNASPQRTDSELAAEILETAKTLIETPNGEAPQDKLIELTRLKTIIVEEVSRRSGFIQEAQPQPTHKPKFSAREAGRMALATIRK